MKKLTQILLLAATVAALGLTANHASAQQDQGPQDRGRRGNFDPAQMRQRMLERYREQMDVKDDNEWKLISERISKVMEARRDVGFGGMGFAFRGPDRGSSTTAPAGDNPPRRRFGPEPSAEEQALEKAIESKASNEELKARIAKLRDARKAKEEKLEKAQDDLRKVLSVRQEAVAVLDGLLK